MSVIASNSAGKVSFDIGGLRGLAREIKASRNMRVRVGLFPGNAARKMASKDIKDRTKEGYRKIIKGSVAEITTPEIGATHEFGSKSHNIPARSWLRMPIMLYLRSTVEDKDRAWWHANLSTKGMHTTLKKLGTCAQIVIQNSFESGGFGHWRPLAKATIRAKGSSAVLIDTAQLRKAVASKVVRV